MNIYDHQLENDGRILHHLGLMLVREEHTARPVRCAWCDAETGRKPDPAMNETHGICTKHRAGMDTELEQLRRKEAE
jgi:hypothetical protein